MLTTVTRLQSMEQKLDMSGFKVLTGQQICIDPEKEPQWSQLAAGLNEKTQLGDFLPPVQPKGTTFLISFCKQLVIKSHNC